MRTRAILEYSVAGVIVILLGTLAGWYFFLRAQTQTTVAQDTARGYGASTASFGDSSDAGQKFTTGSKTGQAATAASKPAQLWHVETAPAAGMAFSTSTPLVEYVERSSGYVFQADPQTSAIERLTNTLTPKIYQALFTGGGHVIERSIGDSGAITTFAGSFSTSTSSASNADTAVGALSGSYLQTGIRSMAADPRSDQIFSIVETANGASGVRSQWDGSKAKTLFTSPLVQWNTYWISDGRIILLQAPADGIAGYAYALGSNGTLKQLASGVGLTVLPRASSTALLYGESGGGTLALFARVASSTTDVRLPIHTVADKCVWAPGVALIAYCAVPQVAPVGNFLDNWYRGAAHTADSWWRVDISAGTAQVFFTPDANLSLDVEEPVIDQGGNYIAFLNGADQSLWILRLQK